MHMELEQTIRSRRMCRNFLEKPLADGQLDRMLDLARRVPSAGYSQGFHFLVLEGPLQTARFWDHTLPFEDRATFGFPRLLLAPVIVLALADADAYVQRYAEPDKAVTGLGEGAAKWPVPYWWGDTAMAVQNLLLVCANEGLGALYFGIFRNEQALLADLGVPAGIRPLGVIAIGHPTPDAFASREGSAKTRPRLPFEQIVHRNGW